MDAGVPGAIREATVTFRYNDLASLEALLERCPDRIAAVFLEPATGTAEPAPGFLEGLRALADRDGFVLVFDEMITGMRWSASGAQDVYGVTPDLSTWGKAMGNGFSVAALCGKRSLMELGGLNTDAPRVFLLSTTHGAESTGLAASLAVAAAYEEWDVVGTMERQGEKLRAGVQELAAAHGLEASVTVSGRPSCLVFGTLDHDGRPSQAYRALFLQELLRRGVLGQSFVISAAHTDEDVARTLEACDGAMAVYAKALAAGSTDGLLEGRPVAPALRRYAHPRRLG
jgi:glutamate-1-semialdehyde 2,1-aminomutase